MAMLADGEKPCPVLLLVRELHQGGSERQMTAMALSLDRSRFTPHVGCCFQDGLRGDELRASNVPVAEFPLRSFGSPSVLAAGRRLVDYIRRNGIRLVHSFDVPMNIFAVPCARLAGTPVVLSSQRGHRMFTPGVWRHILRLTDQMVDGIVVNCQYMRRHLIEDDRVADSLIHVCYNGIDLDAFRPLDEPPPAELPTGSVVIGTVCALRPEKGVSLLLQAFARLPRRSGAVLVVVGDGPEEASLRRLAAELGIAGECTFVPATSRVAQWLSAIDIFVLPSLSEALSNSLMEAMACGCCVVASDVGGTPELVRNGSGVLFPCGDAEALAAALRFLVENEPARRKYSVEARRFLCERFSLAAASRRMGEIYSTMLSRAGTPAPSGRNLFCDTTLIGKES